MLEKWNYNWVNGSKVQAATHLEVLNPASGEIIGQVPDLDPAEVVKAVDAASLAFPIWAARPAPERAAVLEDWAARLLADRTALAELMTLEQGKPLSESLGEIEGAAAIIKWYAEEAKRSCGEIIPASNPYQQLLVYREPVGVAVLITPMNFPAATVARKMAPALAAGCSLILKPAETTPLTAIAMFGHLMQTALPKGTANLVTGQPARTGEVLLADERVRKISFTGSTRTGKQLMQQAASTVKRMSMELGGNSPVIVFPDADLDKAAHAVAANKFENCGQVCNGINAVYLHRDIKESFLEKLMPLVQGLKVGPGMQPGTDVGPLIDEKALAKVERLVRDAQRKGAKVMLGGKSLAGAKYAGGHFYAPTLLDEVTDNMDIAQEEIFGPVAPVLTFDSEEEVLARVNATRYGLAAYVFTGDFRRIHRMISGIQAGNIGINGTSLAYLQSPFGGVKESGIGREGGRQGLEEYTVLKYVAMTIS
ncbi:NAD-dependent succinate-semialdehyde dehydrogenase [Paenibacillus albidus]|nr:NAD-dependent succinate-semialdehyde dehydrogenase [Paenibacillus albidus]